MIERIFKKSTFLFAFFLLSLLTQVEVTRAQSISADELIIAINDLRASKELPAYQIDAELMTYAQEHAEYQASLNDTAEVHSDGSLPKDHGLKENVAVFAEGEITAESLVNEAWAEWT